MAVKPQNSVCAANLRWSNGRYGALKISACSVPIVRGMLYLVCTDAKIPIAEDPDLWNLRHIFQKDAV